MSFLEVVISDRYCFMGRLRFGCMATSLAKRLRESLIGDRRLVETLETDWSGAKATNGLKVWIADEMGAPGREFWCNFKGERGFFASRAKQLANQGRLHEMEFLLDVIAFDGDSMAPSIGVEIEQSYSRKKEDYEAKERIVSRAIAERFRDEQKDLEFCYDFSRLLAVAPLQGIFVGLSYRYEESLSKWVRAFRTLLSTARTSAMRELAILFILTVPRKGQLEVATYGWSVGNENDLQDYGITSLR